MKTTTRRLWMLGASASACAIAAAAGGPVAALVLAPIGGGSRSGGRWIKTSVTLAQLEAGKPRRVPIVSERIDAWTKEKDVELGSVWLLKRGDRVTAFSTVCPHLGCFVNVAPDNGFSCPCHASSFDADGKRGAGPSPRDLDTLETRIEDDGHIAVDFRRFRLGIAEKVET